MDRMNKEIKDLQDKNNKLKKELLDTNKSLDELEERLRETEWNLEEAEWSLEDVEEQLEETRTELENYELFEYDIDLGSFILDNSDIKNAIVNALIEDKPIKLPKYIINDLITLLN